MFLKENIFQPNNCQIVQHYNNNNNNNNNNNIYLFTAIGLSPGGSGYFTCIENIKLVTTEFKSGGLHEKHIRATWNLGNHLSICL